MASLHALAERWPEINTLLDEVLALPTAQRGAWLDALQGPQAELRETLARLLAAQLQVDTGDFLATLPALNPPAATDEPRAVDTVGPYRLLHLLGRGGMGQVWRAERTDGQLKRAVALKLPRLAWDTAISERLARERDILASLAHPHIARLYDAGVDRLGRPYLAMELVEGEPIDGWCSARQASVAQRVALLLQVAAALAHAHARLVIHRDLKPSNILVTADGQVRLLDFGIAKLLQGDTAPSTELTRVAGAAMTLDYASPEQIRGEPLSTATDVYSLGVVAYELLSGTRPYRLERGSAAELEEAITRIDVPLASSMAATATLKRALRGDLDAILNQALRKAPGGRYASVEALAADLSRHLRHEPVLARPDVFGYRSWRWLQRHRVQAVALALAGGGLVVGSGVALWQARVAQEEARRAGAEVQRQEAVRNLYIDTMTRLDVMARDQPESLTRPGAVNQALRTEMDAYIERYASLPGAVQAQLEAVALQLNYASDFEGSLAVGQRYLAHLKTHDAEPALVINAHNLLGRTLFQLRRLAESEAVRRAGVAWAPTADDLRTAQARLRLMLDLVNLLANRGRRPEAWALLQQAGKLSAARVPAGTPRAQVLHRQSTFQLMFDDPAALEAAEAAHRLVAADPTADDDQRENDLFVLTSAQLAGGEAARAVPPLREALALNLKLYGQTDRNTGRAAGRLAAALARSGAADEARRSLDDLLARQPAAPAGGATPANLLILRGRAVELAWLRGDLAAALPLLASEPADYARQLSTRGGEQLLGYEVRALLLAGRPREALARAQRLRDTWPEPVPVPSIPWLRMLETLALAQLGTGDAAAARASTEQLVALFEQGGARASWPWKTALELAALAAQRSGDGTAATTLLARASAVPASAPSAIEAADAAVQRAELLAALGRGSEARATASAALADLPDQHPDSPRRAALQRLLPGG